MTIPTRLMPSAIYRLMPRGYAPGVPNTTGGILLALRKKLEMTLGRTVTQTEVAKAIGKNQTDISKYERDESLPKGPALMGLAQFYGVTIEELLPRAEQTTAERAKRAEMALGGTPSENKPETVTLPVTQAGVQPYTDPRGSSQRQLSRAGGSHARSAVASPRPSEPAHQQEGEYYHVPENQLILGKELVDFGTYIDRLGRALLSGQATVSGFDASLRDAQRPEPHRPSVQRRKKAKS
jgi:transcriptional regulator with XRE-family HTH domain